MFKILGSVCSDLLGSYPRMEEHAKNGRAWSHSQSQSTYRNSD